MSELVQVAVDAALAAGKIQRERSDKVGDITYKETVSDPVTEVDLLCEKEVVDRIKKHFPDHEILAEEGGAGETRSTSKWIIDPLDGTLNYSHGFPCYCVSIGFEHEGELTAGVIYNPSLDELFVAEKGKGATLNSKPISVTRTATLGKSLLVTGFSPTLGSLLQQNLKHFCKFMESCQAVRRPGSAALDLAYTAAGRFEGFWELNLHPWDTAAGVLLMQEAGGKVTRFDGSPYSIYDKEVLASNGPVHQAMVDILQSSR